MKILITGGAGFMGSEVVRQSISKGFDVVVVDCLTYAGDLERLKEVEGKYKFYQTDITDSPAIVKIMAKEKPDVVIHMAAETHVDRSILDSSSFIDTNVKGTRIMLDAAKENNVKKFINMSTDEVYGALGEDGQFSETTPLDPNSPYSASKAAADMLGRAYFKTHNLPVITIRAANNYGPWQYPEKLVPVMIIKAFYNEPLPVYGKGENVREWLYVSDFANAMLMIVENGKPGEIYNIGSDGQEKKNIETVKTILDLMKKPETLINYVTDRPGHDFRYSLKLDKIKNELGWKPEVTFDEGMENTVDWYLNSMKWVDSKMTDLREYWKKAYK
jgi:dTDP-glucose 4,6-dehydratase